MLKKLLWIIFLLLIITAAGLGLFWVVTERHWPWWMAAVLGAGLLGLILGILYLKRYLLRSRERKFVQRVIEQDQAAIASAPAAERQHLLALQEHWMESVKRLQDSTLRSRGNPLYVLPWYLMIGESGMGKTSALKNARASSPMTEIGRASGTAGTRNCDWWFFDRAIVLDTAGRYTIPIDEGKDLEEWKELLTLLSRYRKKEPVNGVIVALAADRLLAGDEKKLREDGQSIRQRIDQTMKIIGARFPVYVLITKMDLVHGFSQFCRSLPEESRSQSMGYTNTEIRLYWHDVMDRAMNFMRERLARLRMMLFHRADEPSAAAVMFPTEFERLAPGLEIFLKAVFEENQYQETPIFRGLFFSSALRQGKPVSDFLKTFGLTPEPEPEKDPESGYFLRDFYQAILPRDRNLYAPVLQFIRWRRMTRSVGLVSWLLVGFSVCGLLAFSFFHNLSAIRGFSQKYYDPSCLTDDVSANLMIMDQMRREILDMQATNRGWILPRFGLDHSLTVAERLRGHYLNLFRSGFLIPLDERLFADISAIGEHTPEERFVEDAAYVVTRITVMKEYLAGKKATAMDEFKGIAAGMLSSGKNQVQPEIAAKFGDVYQAYLIWTTDRSMLAERLSAFREALVLLLEKKGRDLHWLTRTWIPDSRDVHLNDFWGISEVGDYRGRIVLPAAFTEDGRKHIAAFITRIEDALADEPIRTVFDKRVRELWTWYRMQFFQTWHDFIVQFHEGMNRMETVAGWKRMAALMTTDQNPYFRLLQRMAGETAALGAGEATPPWVDTVIRLTEVRDLARTRKKAKDGSLTGALTRKKEDIAKEAYEAIDRKKVQEIEARETQADAWERYLNALGKIDISVASRKQAADMYAGCFGGADGSTAAGGAGQSPFVAAYGNYYQLKGLIGLGKEHPVVWDMVFGPLDFVMAYAANETACFLQEQWQEQVMGPIDGADPEKVPRMLFDKSEGLVWKFLGQPAKPFVGRSDSGYFTRRDFRNKAIPLEGDFIHFLNSGSTGFVNVQPRYAISLETLPLDVNDEASAEPYAGILTVNCADAPQVLKNYNYPSRAQITWSPETCGDVLLEITFPRMVLKHRYPGKTGFPSFIKDFRAGSRTFQATEFPEDQENLKHLGIQWIRVSYKIDGADPVLRLLDRLPAAAPESIVSCWGRKGS